MRCILLAGLQAADVGTELWTLARVRETIQRRFGVLYNEVHVWQLLRKLAFPSQTPGQRTKERDEAAITRWKERTWPAQKKCCQEGCLIAFVDESGLSERPTRARK